VELERSKVIPAPAERVFEIASDVERMASWLPTTQRVRADGPDHVHVEGETGRGHYESEGLFRARPEQLRLEWGSEQTGEYAGWLQVAHQGDGSSSEVVIHLSFLEDLDEEYRAGDPESLDSGLGESLDRLAEQVAAGS